MEKKVIVPYCVRCRVRQAVACVRHPIGHKDAVCVACMAPSDAMLPLYWPGVKEGSA